MAAAVWTLITRNEKRENYNVLYYWLRVAVRYRTAIGIIAFGFLKLYPMQMPKPSLANLATNLGDYDAYKIYWQIVGVSIWYEIVLGVVEILGGILLFFRGTTALGAVLVAGVLYNIAHANFAYDGGVHVYASFFVLTSAFLLVPYIPHLWKLLIKHEDTKPAYYYPRLKNPKQRIWFYGSKYLFVFLFTIIFGILRYDVHYHVGQLKDPVTPGLPHAYGYYNVTEFRRNGKVIPYSPLDSVRWQNVIFEKWSTLVYQVNKPFPISLGNGVPSPNDIDRTYEMAGTAGGRKYLFYTFDEGKGKLYLEDKSSPGAGQNEDEEDGKPKRKNAAIKTGRKGGSTADKREKLVWNFYRPTASTIILSGLNEYHDSIYVVLDKTKKDFPISIDRSKIGHLKNELPGTERAIIAFKK